MFDFWYIITTQIVSRCNPYNAPKVEKDKPYESGRSNPAHKPGKTDVEKTESTSKYNNKN